MKEKQEGKIPRIHYIYICFHQTISRRLLQHIFPLDAIIPFRQFLIYLFIPTSMRHLFDQKFSLLPLHMLRATVHTALRVRGHLVHFFEIFDEDLDTVVAGWLLFSRRFFYQMRNINDNDVPKTIKLCLV